MGVVYIASMRTKGRITVAAVCLLAVCAAAGATLLLAHRTNRTRRLHLETTAAQIRQGNYYAWGQVWMWLEKLSPEEKKYLFASCAQYASSNRVVHVTGCDWPPDNSTFNSLGRPPSFLVWVRQVTGMSDNALMYDDILCPPGSVVQVSKFHAMYTSHANVAP